jgi:drug/metabolite transporter (DMT)-like permease
LAGILNALTPLFVILVGISFFPVKSQLQKIIGVMIGFAGLCLLMLQQVISAFEHFSYSLLILLATLFYGINVNMVGRHMQGIGSLNIASLAFVFLIIPCIIILYFTGYFALPLTTKDVLLATLASCVLGVMGTAVASIFFICLPKRAGTYSPQWLPMESLCCCSMGIMGRRRGNSGCRWAAWELFWRGVYGEQEMSFL